MQDTLTLLILLYISVVLPDQFSRPQNKLKAQLTPINGSEPAVVQTRKSLYESYAAMLLGYLQEVVTDKQLAEDYLVDIFNELQFADIQAITKAGTNTFLQLQQIARRKLIAHNLTVAACPSDGNNMQKPSIKGNKFIAIMSAEQQHVFCGMHYHGKSIAALASELAKPQEEVRKILKASFLIIRNQRNDTAAIHR